VELIGVAWPATAMTFAASMIMQGLFDKFPQLRVLIQESGLWWVIDFMLRMDELYLGHPEDVQLVERKLESGERYLRHLPSEYVQEHFRFTTQPMAKPNRAEHLSWLLELAHADRLLVYSSDWPHATFDPVNWALEGGVIGEALAERILSANARQLFKRL
jgi:predicted TIM-barrel fold metal-dependent hydrolase